MLHPYTLPGGLGAHKWRDRTLVDALTQTPLLIDADGTVLEAGWANVLIRRGGILLRPRADGRILPGTSLPPAEEADLTLEDLRRADEILVSSSIAGVVPAVLAGRDPDGMPEAGAGYRAVMADRQAWDLAFDPATGFRLTQEQVGASNLLPSAQWPNFFSRLVARLQWDARAIDLTRRRARVARARGRAPRAPDDAARRLPGGGGRRRRAHRAVRRGGQQLPGVLGALPPAPRRAAPRGDVRPHRRRGARAPRRHPGRASRRGPRAHAAGVLELFEERLPAMAGELAAGRTRVDAGIGLYHMILEGIVLLSGQRALVADLEDGAMPGVLEGVERVEKDERWHIGFGLRCLIDAKPSPELIDEVLAMAEDAAGAWGDAVPKEIRDAVVPMCHRRLAIAKLIGTGAAA